MHKIKIGLCAAALAGAVIPLSAASAAPRIYAVTVTTNFGTQFTDCFTFKGAYLYIAGLAPKPLVTTVAPTTPKYYYTAVAGLPLVQYLNNNFAFSGFKTGDSQTGTLSAVGADAVRDSYAVSGTAVPSCPTQAKSSVNNWIRPR